MFDYFIKNRHVLLDRVCFRNYACGDKSEMIIINIPQNVTTFLEGLSADFFEMLATRSKEEIIKFAKENSLLLDDINDFIEELLRNNTIINEICDNNTLITTDVDVSKDDFLEFENLLYKFGYLYSVHIDITYACNLRCLHCYHDFDSYENKEEMSFQNICQFIDDVYDLGAFHITLSGGEATLRNDFWRIVEYITSKGMIITIFTNATLINEIFVKKIKTSNIFKIGISLYSTDEKIHDMITNTRESFNKTQKAISLLKNASVNIEIKCVLLKYNFTTYSDLRRYCEKNNFSLVFDTSMTSKLTGDKTPINYSFEYEQIMKFSQDKESNYFVMNSMNNIDINIHPCSAGKISLYCNPSGDIFPCVSLRIYLGQSKDIKNIWKNSSKLQKWRDIKIKNFSDCGKHDYCNFCIEICAGISQLENGNFKNSNSSNCIKAQARQQAYKELLDRSL